MFGSPEPMEVDVKVIGQKEATSGTCPTGEDSIKSGSLMKSSSADSDSGAEGLVLFRGYKEIRKGTEEYAMEFLCNTIQHPVISCLRELGSPDLNHIIGNNKLKKQNGALEQGLIHLALIDYIAVTINNPLYTEKPMKNIPTKVQKIMMDFKNIIGSWGMSDTPVFKQRFEIVMKYLRDLVVYFKPVHFDEIFTKILDSIESVIARSRQNYEKIKAISTYSPLSPSSTGAALTNQSQNYSGVPTAETDKDDLTEIDLNISLDIGDIENEDDDIPCPSSHMSWFNLRPPTSSDWKRKLGNAKAKKDLESIIPRKKSRLDMIIIVNDATVSSSQSSGSTSSSTASSQINKKDQAKKSYSKPKKSQTVPKTKDAEKTESQSTDNNKAIKPGATAANAVKLSSYKKVQDKNQGGGDENSTSEHTNPRKDHVDVDVTVEIKKTVDVDKSKNNSEKPKLNAFAVLMNRSREIAEQKKKQKLANDSTNVLKNTTQLQPLKSS